MADERHQLSPGQCKALLDWIESGESEATASLGYQGSVRTYQGPAGAFVIKAPAGRGLRRILGRAAIRREEHVYGRLRGIPGIPECYGRIGGQYLVLAHIPGGTLHARESDLRDREKYFAGLLATLRKMHDAGVAHGDLKRKRNILVGPGEQPFVIDFGIAVLANGQRGFLFELVRQVDRNAWVKHKYRGQMNDIAVEDAPLYKPMRSESLMRVLRTAWHAATLRRWRKRRRRAI